MIIREAPPPGYNVPWSVGVGAAAPVASRLGLRSNASIVVTKVAKNLPRLPRGCWPTMNMIQIEI